MSTKRIQIQSIGSHGEGLGSTNGTDIYVAKTAPGDDVEVELLEKKKGRYRAKKKELYSSGPERTEVKCRHFEYCGGCDFQHIPYDKQLEWKRSLVQHWIQRSPLARFINSSMLEIHPAPQPYFYRHRVRIQVQNGKPGFYLPRTHEFFEIEECPVLEKGFFEAILQWSENQRSAKNASLSFDGQKILKGESHYMVGAKSLQYDSSCFTQANWPVNEQIWQSLRQQLLAIPQRKHALDLFCGVGNFSLGLKDLFDEVTAVESHPRAIAYAQKNEPSIKWMESSAEIAMNLFEKRGENFDFVLLDPPRSGALSLCRQLSAWNSAYITYISCNVSSLIRDLYPLLSQGKYQVQSWQLFDLLPQTKHIESVVHLKHPGP